MSGTVEILLSRAISAHEREDWETAEGLLEEILAREPGHPGASHQMARLALEAGYPDDALEWLDRADGVHEDARFTELRVRVLQELGREEEAIAAGREALARGLEDDVLRFRVAHGLQKLRRFEEARQLAESAVAATPGHGGWLWLLGCALAGLGEHAAAEEVLRKSWRAGDVRGAGRLGQLFLTESKWVDARALYEEALESHPKLPVLLSGVATACQMLGRMDGVRAAMGKWVELEPRNPQVFSQWITVHAGDESMDAAALLAQASMWEGRFGAPPDPLPPFSAPVVSEERPIRVGFVSPTFRRHANCNFLLPLLEALGRREDVEVFAYHDNTREDAVTERCRRAVKQWKSTAALSPREAAATIRADGIDVLIDTVGHFDDGRLSVFAYRPARCQVHYLGGFASTGLTSMDWRLADEITEPVNQPGGEVGTERVYRIPGGIHAYRPLAKAAAPNDPPCLRNGYVTFGCLNALTKMESGVFRLWGEVLTAVPGARLRIVKSMFSRESSRKDFAERAAVHGIDPERLELLEPGKGEFEDLSVYHGIDIALDTMPYNGVTTTCEALWMGVPVATLLGQRFLAREAAAIIRRVGHPEWVAASRDEYVAIARKLAGEPETLQAIRSSLREDVRKSPVGDSERLAREFAAFARMAISDGGGPVEKA